MRENLTAEITGVMTEIAGIDVLREENMTGDLEEIRINADFGQKLGAQLLRDDAAGSDTQQLHEDHTKLLEKMERSISSYLDNHEVFEPSVHETLENGLTKLRQLGQYAKCVDALGQKLPDLRQKTEEGKTLLDSYRTKLETCARDNTDHALLMVSAVRGQDAVQTLEKFPPCEKIHPAHREEITDAVAELYLNHMLTHGSLKDSLKEVRDPAKIEASLDKAKDGIRKQISGDTISELLSDEQLKKAVQGFRQIGGQAEAKERAPEKALEQQKQIEQPPRVKESIERAPRTV